MTPGADTVLARAWVALADRAWPAVALVLPLVLLVGVGVPDAGTALGGLVVAVVLAIAPRGPVAWLHRVVTLHRPVDGEVPPPSWRMPDPVHHPLRPRAPGLV
jgi:hypothetical protein